MKKAISLALCCFLMLGFFVTVASAEAPSKAVTPRLNNVGVVKTLFEIVDGVAVIKLSYSGYEGVTTYATITTTLQKRSFLFFWNDVEEWINGTHSVNWSKEHTYPVSSGTYRVKVKYEIEGTGGATDVIEEELTDSY